MDSFNMKLGQTNEPSGLPTQLEFHFTLAEQIKTLRARFPNSVFTCPGFLLPDLLGDLDNEPGQTNETHVGLFVLW